MSRSLGVRFLLLLIVLITLVLSAFMLGAGGKSASVGQVGKYPLYGHADDFSWIAGQMTFEVPPTCMSLACGCAIVQYDADGSRFQLAGPGWDAVKYNGEISQEMYLIAFGRLARSDEYYHLCKEDDTAPIYVVTRIQGN